MNRKRKTKRRKLDKRYKRRDFTDAELWGDGTLENPGRAFLCRDPKRENRSQPTSCKLLMRPFGYGKLLGVE